MQNISGVSNFKRNVLGHDQVYYLKEGKKYVDRAYQQQQNNNSAKAERSFTKAQETFNIILPSERTSEVNRSLAQAYLEQGDRLRDMSSVEQARASYEAALAFDPRAADQRLQALSAPKAPNPSTLPSPIASLISPGTPAPLQSVQVSAPCFKHNPLPVVIDDAVSAKSRDIKNAHHLARCLRSAQPPAAQELNELARNVLEAFGQRDFKGFDLWREVVPLAATADPDKCRYLGSFDGREIKVRQALGMGCNGLNPPFASRYKLDIFGFTMSKK